jgi:hypothetical protein
MNYSTRFSEFQLPRGSSVSCSAIKFNRMIVPICLFSGLTNYGTQTLSTFMLTSLCCVCTNIIECLSILSSILSTPVTRSISTVLRPSSIAFTLVFLNCCSHPMTKQVSFLLFVFIEETYRNSSIHTVLARALLLTFKALSGSS